MFIMKIKRDEESYNNANETKTTGAAITPLEKKKNVNPRLMT